MSTEQIKLLLEKHNISFDLSTAELLNAIASLPTSEICDLFNDIAINNVFTSDVEKRLF